MMQRENVYIGAESGDSTDFKDVFGGPPRRFSMQEVTERYSFGDSSSEEKPVFGEERRRRKGADFFDDIFKGSPRRSDRDGGVFGSNPGSRIMSPARPFSPKPDSLPFSLPAHFSLPAKSTKGVDLPLFGSNSHGQHGGSYESSNPHSWGPFSRFSNEASRSLDDMIRNEAQLVRPLSDEAEDSPFNAISDEDVRNVDSIGDQFHFSIYKWAGRGVPMLMPLVIGNNLKSKDSMKYEKPNGTTESKSSSIRNRADKKQDHNYVDEAFYEVSEPKSTSSPNDTIAFDRSVKREPVKSVVGSNAGEKIEKEVPVKKIEEYVAEIKDERTRAPGVDGDRKKVNEKERKGEADGKSAAAKGKVKDFVHIFNQETDSRPKVADVFGSRRRENVDIGKKGNEVSSNQGKSKEQVDLHNTDRKPDVSFKVVEDLKNNQAHRISPKRISTSSRSSSRLRKSFSAGTLLENLKMSQENLEDPLEDTFEVHELSDGNNTVTQNESSSEETRAIDAKIRQWSVGKKGNIRSLLSTLQYVLWAESGWKAVPLVDLIEANSVKKAYQKALLRLHPDKLQQKGAAFQHKYIAEKVFDILQEAWDHFNTCSSLGI